MSVPLIGRRVPVFSASDAALPVLLHMTVIWLHVCELMHAEGSADTVCTMQTVNDAAADPPGESAPIIGMGAEYPQLLEVTERLNENVAQLHRSVCLFMGQAWKKVPAHPLLPGRLDACSWADCIASCALTSCKSFCDQSVV